MKLYFFGNPHSTPLLKKRFEHMMSLFEKMGILVLSNLKKTESFTQEIQKMLDSQESLIEKIDALVIEGSNQSFESAHLIALAIAHRKPVLYAVEKNKYIDKNLLKLEHDKKAKKYFRIEFYSEKNLSKLLEEFIESAEHGAQEGRTKPTIKFTLRITPKMERYLQWRTHNSKFSKADYLREEIEKMMKEDKEYQKFIQMED